MCRNAAVFLFGSWEVDTTADDVHLHSATLSVYGNIFFSPGILNTFTLNYLDTVPSRGEKLTGGRVKNGRLSTEL
jgi:hypothetical protein